MRKLPMWFSKNKYFINNCFENKTKQNTWFGLSSYLYFFENNLAIEIFTANETIAMLRASPNISGIIDIGGIIGTGNLKDDA